MTKYKIAAVFGILCIAASLFIFARHRQNNNRYYLVEDSPKTYSINAQYSAGQFNNVRNHLDKKLGAYTDFSFRGAEMDADVTLNNDASFYLLLKPGRLQIKLNKQQNTEHTYQLFSELGRELENVMALQ